MRRSPIVLDTLNDAERRGFANGDLRRRKGSRVRRNRLLTWLSIRGLFVGFVVQQQNEFVPVLAVAYRLELGVGFLLKARRAGYRPPSVVFRGEVRYHWPTVAAWAAERGLAVVEAYRVTALPAE